MFAFPFTPPPSALSLPPRCSLLSPAAVPHSGSVLSISLASEDQGLSSRRPPRGGVLHPPGSLLRPSPLFPLFPFAVFLSTPTPTPLSSLQVSLHFSIENANLDVAQAQTLRVTPTFPPLTPTFRLSASPVTSKQPPPPSYHLSQRGPSRAAPPPAPPAALAPPFVGASEPEGTGKIPVRPRRSQHPPQLGTVRGAHSPEENSKCLLGAQSVRSPSSPCVLLLSPSLTWLRPHWALGCFFRHGPASGLCSKSTSEVFLIPLAP